MAQLSIPCATHATGFFLSLMDNFSHSTQAVNDGDGRETFHTINYFLRCILH